ncbi:DUF1801 domain-containing protein [Devosia sp.]|uniref:DUF1801 domain-containing protein n=1 Tax=Devosia sp. TaxID=1871048 RepID=UPI003A8F30E8
MAAVTRVDDYMARLAHARKPEIERLRAMILSVSPAMVEQIKWNAPSFGIGDEDRVTMRLQPGERVQLILHRGAKVRDASDFDFIDESGLLRWLARDRGEVTVRDAAHLDDRAEAIRTLVERWIAATR